MKMYVLISGKYEDCEIHGIFSSVKKLEEFKNRFPNNYNLPEEYCLDHIPDRPNNEDVYYVYLCGDNEIKAVKESIKSYRLIGGEYRGKCEDGPKYFHTYLWATNEEDAIKKGNEIFLCNG